MDEEMGDEIERFIRGSILAEAEGFVKVGVDSATGGKEWVWCEPVDPMDENNKLLRITSVTHFAEATADDIIEATADPDGTDWLVMTGVVERARSSIIMKHAEISYEDYEGALKACEELGVKIGQINRIASVFAIPLGWDEDRLSELFEAADKWMDDLIDWPDGEMMDLTYR